MKAVEKLPAFGWGLKKSSDMARRGVSALDDSSCRPYGTWLISLLAYPALKQRAIVGRFCGDWFNV